MKTAGALLAVWLFLAVAAVVAVHDLTLDYRIDAFLPTPDSAQQALVVDQVGSGPGGRMILAALSGAEPEELARASEALAEGWRDLAGVDRVDNGRFDLDAETEAKLMRYRFLLLAEPERWLDEDSIARHLGDRLAEISAGGGRIESLARRDPLGMLPALAERLTPESAAQHIDGVWFDAEGERALLSLMSRHPPFETEKQAQLLESLERTFRELDHEGLTLQLGGAPVIAVDSAERSRANATWLGMLGGGFVLIVLLWAWRSPLLVAAGAIPLGTGLVAGLVMTSLVFDSVHGLTLAFGVTLLGVALDYPVHLFSHAAGSDWRRTRRDIRQPLLLGMLSTTVAYLAIWQSTSPGLAQLGAFCAAGLPAAAGATLLLPQLGLGPVPVRAQRSIRLPRSPWLVAVLAVAGLGVLLVQGDGRWSDALERLSPVNQELLAADASLRGALGAGDVRYLVVTGADSLDEVLERTERATRALAEARGQGLIESWQAVDTLLPSSATVAERRQAWPKADEMARRIEAAEPRFREDAFEPFIDDLESLADTPAPTPETWAETPLDGRVESLVSSGPWGWRSIIVPAGLDDPDALAQWLADHPSGGAELVDLKGVSEAMVAAYRREAGLSLIVAAGLIILVLLARLRRPRQVGRVLLPPAAAVLVTAAVMSVFDGGLSIVHLIGLLLTAGIGLDFSLFAHTLSAGADQRARTNRALTICAISSGGVFLLLGQSDIGLLRMLGLTVALGILLSWFLARISQPECPKN